MAPESFQEPNITSSRSDSDSGAAVPVCESAGVRPEMIETALKFLQNPKVASTPTANIIEFLTTKGLSDVEIATTLDRVKGEGSSARGQHMSPFVVGPYDIHSPYGPGILGRLAQRCNAIATLGISGYALYHLIRDYVIPLIWKRLPKKDSTHEAVKHMSKVLSDLRSSIDALKVEVRQVKESRQSAAAEEIAAMRKELSQIKAMLLSRDQFAPLPSAAAIPSWQKQQDDDLTCDGPSSPSASPEMESRKESVDTAQEWEKDGMDSKSANGLSV